MRNSTIITIFLSVAVTLSFNGTASSRNKEKTFRKGVFAGAEVSAGATVGAKMLKPVRNETGRQSGEAPRMPDYELGMFCGYRFLPQIAVAAGIGGSNSIVTGTTSMPVFLRLRSDILDRKVSPMVQVDVGYAFQFAYSKHGTSELSYNSDPFQERYTSLGFNSQEEYVDARLEEFMARFGNLSENEASRLREEERGRIINSLRCFDNGQRSYLPSDVIEELGNFSQDGFFGSLTAGLSIGVGKEQSRISAGVSVGVAQYSYSIPLRAPDNSFINMSVPASLPDGTPVIIARTSIKDNPIRLNFRLRVSWEF